MATFNNPRHTAATVTASATLVRGYHTPVDATAGPLTMTLPGNAPVGVEISVEKVDSSANAVVVSGTMRGAPSTVSLTYQYEGRTFLSEGSGSWRPTSDHRTSTSLSALVTSTLAADSGPANAATTAVTNAIAARPIAETPVFDDEITDLSFAVTDSNNRRTWIEATTAGNPTPRALQKIRDGGVSTDPLDDGASPLAGGGLAYSILDASGRRTDLELGPDGHLTDRVVNLLKTRVGAANVRPTYPDPTHWSHWGDSLTGEGSNGGWTAKLQAKTGAVAYYNGGVGSQGSMQIAGRQGGVPPAVAAFTIPASGASAALTFLNQSPVSDLGRTLAVTIAGVHGTLNFDPTALTTSFTRDGSGTTVAVPQGTQVVSDVSVAHRADMVTIWSGRNSVSSAMTPEAIISTIAAMHAYLTPEVKRVLILDVYPCVGEENGTAARTKLDTFNSMLAARFPESIVRVSTYLRSEAGRVAAGVTWTTQDNTDLANGIVPTSLRADGTHPNQAGGNAIAQVVYDEAHNRGWF